jgi:endonuclease/exonuclease/phosphatase family metal-dependent hydrolase
MLKIMTLNLNYYGDRDGPWPARRFLVCEAIRAEDPDIIAFQAVERDSGLDGGRDQAAQIAEIFPEFKHVFFQPALTSPAGGEQGSAILSRIPWQKTHSKELTLIPGLEDQNRRVLLSAEFDLPAGRFICSMGIFLRSQSKVGLTCKKHFRQPKLTRALICW